jgi:6-phosphogluconate dehydrogenase
MRVGLIGLGKIGEGIARRMVKKGYEVWGYRNNYEKSCEQYEAGYISGCTTNMESLAQMIHNYKNISDKKPGIFMVAVSPENVEETLDDLLRVCREGDIIINYGNSNIEDCWKREEHAAKFGVAYLDCDVDCNICDVDSGYNLMVRGGDTAIATCKGIFHTLGRWDYTAKHSSVI